MDEGRGERGEGERIKDKGERGAFGRWRLEVGGKKTKS